MERGEKRGREEKGIRKREQKKRLKRSGIGRNGEKGKQGEIKREDREREGWREK